MRLVCPNCDAEYEVDASVIPETGRDVQCSNCGHAWFQMSPQMEDELAAEEALFEAPPEAVAAPPRALDDSVLSVLREEAERESAARRAEAPPIETQSELGLQEVVAATVAAAKPEASPEPDTDDDPVAQRIARMKGIEPAPAKPQSRREMLPEIDEINSTLRASSEKRAGRAAAVAETMPETKGRNGFRSGFALVLFLAVIVVALYVMAPKLAQHIPAAAPALKAYVAAIDSARVALDGLLQKAGGLVRGATQ
jgi:predicted Zn finger-like uncharacterized protein